MEIIVTIGAALLSALVGTLIYLKPARDKLDRIISSPTTSGEVFQRRVAELTRKLSSVTSEAYRLMEEIRSDVERSVDDVQSVAARLEELRAEAERQRQLNAERSATEEPGLTGLIASTEKRGTLRDYRLFLLGGVMTTAIEVLFRLLWPHG